MKYKVKNISKDSRRFWVRKSPNIYVLKPNEEIIIEYEPMTITNSFLITKMNDKEIIDDLREITQELMKLPIEENKIQGVTPRKKRNKRKKLI
jgi:hypothetical protein